MAQATGEEAGEGEVSSPSLPPVLSKNNYSPAMWDHPLPESANNLLPWARLEARDLLYTTTPPLETPTTSVILHSTTDDRRLSDISASDLDSANPSSGARNDEWEDIHRGDIPCHRNCSWHKEYRLLVSWGQRPHLFDASCWSGVLRLNCTLITKTRHGLHVSESLEYVGCLILQQT